MAGGPATLKVNIVTDSSKAEAGLRRVGESVDKVGKRIESGFRGAATRITQAFALIGAAHVFSDIIAEAREAAKTSAQTAAVLKSTGQAAGITAKHVSDLATSLSNMAGVDDEAVQQGENLLLTFTRIRNGVGKGNKIFDRATTIALDMSKALGKDLQGSIIQVGKALNDPIKGITALTRVGVTFTEQQKDQIKAMVAAGDTMGAQKLILQELEREFGGFAKASADPFDRFQVALKNFEEAVGTAVLPLISDLLTRLSDLLPKALVIAGKAWDEFTRGFRHAADGTGKVTFFSNLGAQARTLVDWFQKSFLPFWNTTLLPALKTGADTLGKIVAKPEVLTNLGQLALAFLAVKTAAQLATVAIDGFKASLAILTSPLTIAAALLAAPAALLLRLQGRSITVGNVLGVVAAGVVHTAASLVAFGKGAFDVFMSIFLGVVKGIVFLAGLVGIHLDANLKDFEDWKTGIDGQLQGVIDSIHGLGNTLGGQTAAMNGHLDSTKTHVDGIGVALGNATSKVDGLASSLAGLPRETFLSVIVDYRVRNTGQPIGGMARPPGVGATGGIVTRPTLALIGEAGPEAVVPLSSTPGSSPLGRGGAVINITNNFNGVDARAGAEAGRAYVQAIREYERRNGRGWRN